MKRFINTKRFIKLPITYSAQNTKMIEKRDVIGLGQGYLGTIVLFVDGIKGFPVTNSIFTGMNYVSHVGGLI